MASVMRSIERLVAGHSANPAALRSPAHTTADGKVVAYSTANSQKESPLAKFFISGGVTIFFETFAFGHFLEILKIAKQTSSDSYPTIIKRFTGSKGLAGTLDGFFPWGFTQCLVKGSVFGLGQATAKSMLTPPPFGMSDSAAMVLSGGVGGWVQGIIMSPLLLLKTRVMTDASFRATGGVWETALASARVGGQVVAKEGVGALMKGSPTFAMKRFFDWTTRFFFVVQLEEALRPEPGAALSHTTRMLCGLGGGTLSALATIPVDVAVATIQDASKAGQKVNLVKTFMEQENLLAFATRGLVARVAHVAMTTMLMKTGSTLVYDKLFRE